MGTLITFELRKILGNRAGMVSCALVLAMLVALTALDYTSFVTRDIFTGKVVHGAEARMEDILDHGFWNNFAYSDAEKTYWRSHADGIFWPLAWGYVQGWHDALQWKGFSGLAVIAICIALSGVFAGEYRNRTVAITLPTRRGKRALPIAKIAASLIFTTAYWFLLAAIVIGARVVLYGTDGWDLPLQVSQGPDTPYPLTVGQAVVLTYALGYLVALGMSAFALLISSKVRSTMPVAAITMAFVFMGVFGLFITPTVKIALLTPFTGLSYVYNYMVSYAAGPFVADLPTVLTILYAFMLVVLTPLAVRAFRKHQVT